MVLCAWGLQKGKETVYCLGKLFVAHNLHEQKQGGKEMTEATN